MHVKKIASYLKSINELSNGDRIAIINQGELIALNYTKELIKDNPDLEEVFLNLTKNG